MRDAAPPPTVPSRLTQMARVAAVPALLGTTLWVARYWHSGAFGLYEDDLTIIPRAVQMPASELLRFVLAYVLGLQGHARPLSDSFIYLLSNLGWQFGGLSAIYVIGFAVELVNVLLFYWLLRRLDPRASFSLIGGLAYVLFSADTTQAFLTHSLGLQPSLTLLLLATHAWLSDRRTLAYVISFLILFAYETPFPVLLAVPLLSPIQEHRSLRRISYHVLVCFLVLALATLVKASAGEERVTELGLMGAVLTSLNHMVVGPAASAATFLLRPLEAVRGATGETGVFALAGLVGFGWMLAGSDPGPGDDGRAGIAWFKAKIRRCAGPQAISRLMSLAAAGLAMWILAYPLTLTTKGYHIRGRPTRVHLAAALGSSLVVASLGTTWIQSISSPGRRRLGLLSLAAWFGSMMGYGFVLQDDYVQAWQLQKDFWNRVLPLVQDAEDGTVILVEPTGIQDTYQIAANTWNLPEVLPQIISVPSEWKDPPRVLRLTPQWTNSILGEGGLLTIDGTTIVASESFYRNVPPFQVMLIDTRGDPWDRAYALPLDGSSEIPLKPAGPPVLSRLPRGLLSQMLGDPGLPSVGSAAPARAAW